MQFFYKKGLLFQLVNETKLRHCTKMLTKIKCHLKGETTYYIRSVFIYAIGACDCITSLAKCGLRYGFEQLLKRSHSVSNQNEIQCMMFRPKKKINK